MAGQEQSRGRPTRAIGGALLIGLLLVSGACFSSESDKAAFCETAQDLATLDQRVEIDVQVSSEDSHDEAQAKLDAAEKQFAEAADEAQRLIDRFEREAPAEIRDDVELVADYVRSFFRALSPDATDEALFAAGNPTAVNDAADRVAAYVKDECGVDLDAIEFTPPSIPEIPSVPSLPEIPLPSMPSIPPPPPSP